MSSSVSVTLKVERCVCPEDSDVYRIQADKEFLTESCEPYGWIVHIDWILTGNSEVRIEPSGVVYQ